MIIHVNVYTEIDLSFAQNKKAYYYALGEIYFNLSRKNVQTEFEFLIDEKYYLATLRRVDMRNNDVSYELIA